MREPGEYYRALVAAVEDAVRSADPKFLKEGEEVAVGFEGPMGFHQVSPRELLSPFLNTLVCVRGIITKCESVQQPIRSALCVKRVSSEVTVKHHSGFTSALKPW